jgi:hypothetical protein
MDFLLLAGISIFLLLVPVVAGFCWETYQHRYGSGSDILKELEESNNNE